MSTALVPAKVSVSVSVGVGALPLTSIRSTPAEVDQRDAGHADLTAAGNAGRAHRDVLGDPADPVVGDEVITPQSIQANVFDPA